MKPKSDSVLADTFREAMRLWDAAKAAGASREERVASMEKTLRAAWPQGREEPWHYPCGRCHGHGLEMFDCPGDATCGRDRRHLAHEFGKPCWCPAGAKFRPKQVADVDHTEAGSMAKTRKPARFLR